MPCYEPPLEYEVRLPEFLTAALCYATRNMTPEELSGFPGLAEWRLRHDAIDAARGDSVAYDESRGGTGYTAPLFMKQYMAAVPPPSGKR